jgi:hypothetical protein
MNTSERVEMKINEVIEFINRLPLTTKEQRIRIFQEFIEQSKQNTVQREENLLKFKAVFPDIEKGAFKLKNVVAGDLTSQYLKEFPLKDQAVEQFTKVLSDVETGRCRLRETIPGDLGTPVLVRQ